MTVFLCNNYRCLPASGDMGTTEIAIRGRRGSPALGNAGKANGRGRRDQGEIVGASLRTGTDCSQTALASWTAARANAGQLTTEAARVSAIHLGSGRHCRHRPSLQLRSPRVAGASGRRSVSLADGAKWPSGFPAGGASAVPKAEPGSGGNSHPSGTAHFERVTAGRRATSPCPPRRPAHLRPSTTSTTP
jgi:hypothetical protein